MDSDSSILPMKTLFDITSTFFFLFCSINSTTEYAKFFILHYSNKRYVVVLYSTHKIHQSIVFCCLLQLEDVEVSIADHTQKVIKPNFAASWEEIGEGNELEDTYSLSMKTVEGLFCVCWIRLQQVASIHVFYIHTCIHASYMYCIYIHVYMPPYMY